MVEKTTIAAAISMFVSKPSNNESVLCDLI
jgi:hypothetical protein